MFSTPKWFGCVAADFGFRASSGRRQILDRIALRFDMGLAGGGDEIDWRGSHATRVRRWRMVNDRDEELARLNSLEVLPLPMSWLVPGLR